MCYQISDDNKNMTNEVHWGCLQYHTILEVVVTRNIHYMRLWSLATSNMRWLWPFATSITPVFSWGVTVRVIKQHLNDHTPYNWLHTSWWQLTDHTDYHRSYSTHYTIWIKIQYITLLTMRDDHIKCTAWYTISDVVGDQSVCHPHYIPHMANLHHMDVRPHHCHHMDGRPHHCHHMDGRPHHHTQVDHGSAIVTTRPHTTLYSSTLYTH